jgi:molecular chaperone GrpE
MSKKKKILEGKVLKEQLARALADYDNFRKRVEKEQESLVQMAGFSIIERLLSVFDMLEDAQKHLKDSGLAIAIKSFEDVLKEDDVERIPAGQGTLFNENIHEVIEVVRGGIVKDGEIIEELISGWKYRNGPVIRISKVKVGKKDPGIKKNKKDVKK